MKKKNFIILIMLVVLLLVTGCTQAERVSYNLSQEADSFNVLRKITVINQRTDTVQFQVIGNFSVQKEGDGDTSLIGEDEEGNFYKHILDLPAESTMLVEDLGSTGVNRYAYQVNFNPKLILPVTPVIVD